MNAGPTTVLVVDDESAIAETLEELLAAEGYRVSCAASCGEAWTRLAAEPADVVLADVMTPGMSGVDLLRRMRSDPKYQHIPVVLMSSAARSEAIADEKPDAFFRKPFSFTLLLETIAALI